MEVIQQITLPGSVSSVAWDADGEHVAIAVGMSAPYLYRPKEGAPDPQVHLCRVSGGRLHQDNSLPLRPGGEMPTTLKDGKVAFLDGRTLLAAARGVTDEDVTLLVLDCETGEERGRWVWPTFLQRILSDIVPLPPSHVLLSAQENVVCINVDTFQEVCRAREVNEDGDVTEEDASPEEQIAPNGMVNDACTGCLHLLCGSYGESILLRCRLDLSARRFVREARDVFPERQKPIGLCLASDRTLTALLPVADELVDLSGHFITGDESIRTALLTQLRPAQTPPKTAPLGSLVLLSRDLSRSPARVDFDADFARDFTSEPCFLDAGGQQVHIGYRISAGDVRLALAHGDFLTKPVYIDDRRVVVGTPSGFLLCVDTITGQSETVCDFRSRINTLQFHSRTRLLLVGCEDGTLKVLSAAR